MRKMKKVLSLAMTAAMTASLLTGMGAVTASAKKSDDGKRTKITALLKGTESTEQYKTFNYLLKNFCDEKGLDYEIELVNDMQDYFTKLQMYINSDTLPDIFGCPNGTLSKACKDIDALVNVGDELERNGYDEKLNGAIRDFLTDADDGNMYLFPQGLYCEYFMYRKDIFEKAGIKDAPTTWEEFEEDCQKIADQGEIPVIVGGSDAWQLMRYLSFSPWRVTGPEFIEGYQAGTDSFSDNEYVVVRKGYEHPEIVVKIVSVLFDYSRYDADDADEVNGYFALNVDPTARPLVINVDYYDATYMATKDIRKAMNREISEDKLSALEESYYTACTNYLTNYMKGEAVNAEDWAAYKSRISAIGLLVDHGYEPPTIQYLAESDGEAPQILQNLEKNAFIQMVMGNKPMDYFETFVEEWLEQGGRELSRKIQQQNNK